MPVLPSTDALLERLLHHPLPTIELKLERVQQFLARIGNPHLALPPVIHAAGTNGKGSTLAFLRAMLEAAGYRCHVYTSPHLVRFHERIVVSGHEIDDPTLREIVTYILEQSADFPLTFFESTTAAAFLAFSRIPADIVLLETGMGGRLDATNVIPNPVLSVITPVSIDHAEYLGETLKAIASEKAGIIKPGAPCVVGPQAADALRVIEEKAEAVGAPLHRYGKEFRLEATAYISDGWRIGGLAPSLPGAFQWENVATAIACAEVLSPHFTLDADSIRRGVAQARWHGRLQRFRLSDREVWVDGGHNPAAGEALAGWLATRSGKIHLILGMMSDKDVSGYLTPMAPYLTSITAVPISGETRATAPACLAAHATRLGVPATVADTVEAAVAAINADAEVLIGGSLYLAGDVLAKNPIHKRV